MVAGDDDDRCAGAKRVPQPLELPECEDDRGIGRAHRVKQVTGDDDHVGTLCDDVVDHAAEGVGDVGFPLVDARGGLAVVLTDSEVGIRDMGEFHE